MHSAPLKIFSVDAQTGPFGSQLHADEYIEDGVPVINPSNIKDGNLVADRQITVTNSTAERLAMHRLRVGDLVFARRGELGRSGVVSEEAEGWLCGTGSIRVRTDPRKLDSHFAGYALQSYETRSYFSRLAVGSTMDNLNTSIVLGTPIPLLPLETQHRIADFLDTETVRLDGLLTHRAQQMALLQESDKSTITETLDRTGGQPTRLKHLATKITSGPRGWGDLAAESGSLFLRITNIPRRGVRLDLRDSLYVAAEPGPERERSRTQVGDILISITADIGSVALVDERGANGNVSQHIALIRPIPATCSQWLAYALKSARSRQTLRMNSYGGTKAGLGLGDIANLVLDVPSLAAQEEAAARITDTLSQRETLHRAMSEQITLLKERRQALITAAVTGQFDVATASGRNVTEGVAG
ncbi:restriction endonuclease subunit S [Streptomyces sp. P9-A2]|uniref:restriction endonuclease subunit S n=1 Tax=Streptomyces sp. P9-A2 TaxID=3072284 RepID=UPI002FC594B6